MKTKTWMALAILLTLVVGAVATGCGSDDSSKSDNASASAGNATDRAFVAEMVPHHRSAIEMAAIAENEATSSFVKGLATDISTSQQAEIAQMKSADRKLAAAGVKEGDLGMSHEAMGMDMDAGELRGAKPFDAKFIAMMVPHHESAVEMARIELKKGENPQLRKLAKSIISAQQREVKEMRAHASGKSTDSKTDDGSSDDPVMEDEEHSSGH